jgi:hypothetical protein
MLCILPTDASAENGEHVVMTAAAAGIGGAVRNVLRKQKAIPEAVGRIAGIQR